MRIIFITAATMTEWDVASDNPESVRGFLDDCRREGWPIFQLEGVAYVYALREMAS